MESANSHAYVAMCKEKSDDTVGTVNFDKVNTENVLNLSDGVNALGGAHLSMRLLYLTWSLLLRCSYSLV